MNAGLAAGCGRERPERSTRRPPGRTAGRSSAVGSRFAGASRCAPPRSVGGVRRDSLRSGQLAVGQPAGSEYVAKDSTSTSIFRPRAKEGAPLTLVWPDSLMHFYLAASPCRRLDRDAAALGDSNARRWAGPRGDLQADSQPDPRSPQATSRGARQDFLFVPESTRSGAAIDAAPSTRAQLQPGGARPVSARHTPVPRVCRGNERCCPGGGRPRATGAKISWPPRQLDRGGALRQHMLARRPAGDRAAPLSGRASTAGRRRGNRGPVRVARGRACLRAPGRRRAHAITHALRRLGEHWVGCVPSSEPRCSSRRDRPEMGPRLPGRFDPDRPRPRNSRNAQRIKSSFAKSLRSREPPSSGARRSLTRSSLACGGETRELRRPTRPCRAGVSGLAAGGDLSVSRVLRPGQTQKRYAVCRDGSREAETRRPSLPSLALLGSNGPNGGRDCSSRARRLRPRAS